MIRRSRLIADRIRRKPSIRHEREPNAPLPLEGCRCDDCLNARDDAHGRVIANLLDLKPESKEDPDGRT